MRRAGPGSSARPAAACSASAQAGLSRSRAMRQLTSSQAWCRSRSGALNTALASRQTSTTPRSLVLPMTWLCRLRPCVAQHRASPRRARAVGTWITAPSSSLNSACSVSSSRRALDLRGPVLRVAVLGAAVGDAVAFGDQQVDVEAHAEVAGERHLADRGPQAAVAAVVVGEQQAGGAQRVDRRRPATSAAPGRRGRAPRRRTGPAPAPASSRPCASGPGRGRPGPASCRRAAAAASACRARRRASRRR